MVEISPLGLVEMTRQNVSEGVREIMNKTCPTCDGEGVVRSEETIAIDVERGLRKMAKETKEEAFLVQVHPRVAAILIGGGGKPLRELEHETGKLFHFQGSEGIPLDTFRITSEGTRDEIEERALPFKQGEEVLIRIEEPHMYNIDDAIAKIDGYVISVAGGGPYVGESKLIKIDEVKRTAAYASIVTGNGVPETPARRAQPARERKPAAAKGPPPRRRSPPTTPRQDGRQATIERLREQTPPGPQRRSAAFWRSGRFGFRKFQQLQRFQQRMTYAIIEMGGKQYRVAEGDSILVDRVGEDEGAKVSPRALLFADGKNAVMDGADLGKVKVEAVVTEHLKGPKIRVATYRPKKRTKRQMGHRSLR